MKRTIRRATAGFTLVEMLVVLVIIGLLAGLVGPKLIKHGDEAKVKTADTQVKMLKGALETMRLDINRFPTTEEGLALLSKAPTEEKAKARWHGPYIDGDVPADPWGNPYQYAFPGANGQPFVLYSYGEDGQPGGEGNAADIGFLPAK